MSSTFKILTWQNTCVINYAINNYAINYERFSLHSQDCLKINLTEDSAIYSPRNSVLYYRIEFRFEWPAFSFDERHWHLSSFVGGEADEEDLR